MLGHCNIYRFFFPVNRVVWTNGTLKGTKKIEYVDKDI